MREHSRRKGSQNRPSSFKARRIHSIHVVHVCYDSSAFCISSDIHTHTHPGCSKDATQCLYRSTASFHMVASPCSLAAQLRSFSNNYPSRKNALLKRVTRIESIYLCVCVCVFNISEILFLQKLQLTS